MKKQILRTIGGAAIAILVLTIFAQIWVSAQEQNGKEPTLVGSWDVEVTIRDCGTGTPFFSFPAMITYNQGGTMQESDLGAPGITRLNGHGVWERQTGRQYSAAFRWLNFNPDRTFAGTNVARSAISLGHDGNTYTSTDTGELHIGGQVIPLGCGTQTATRFE
ncbi:MAG: hypothetical protein WBD22_11050 [Pyrinomonadaceae bacterium]